VNILLGEYFAGLLFAEGIMGWVKRGMVIDRNIIFNLG
jgi:hypothetical protein